ncbi:MAG TPA: hypothetical protein VKM55_08035 [Candidatus Lokiarchaeia archaeon]|nr:hypothetical protein [Candidatus Lokiarchaeia archaeon]
MLFGTAIKSVPVRVRSPLLFPASAISIDQSPGSDRIGANVPVHDSPRVCPFPHTISRNCL